MFFCVRRSAKGGAAVEEQVIKPTGESPTVCTIRNIIREIETGERTTGNIDITMQSVEAQFGIAHSHLQGGELAWHYPLRTERSTSPVVDG